MTCACDSPLDEEWIYTKRAALSRGSAKNNRIPFVARPITVKMPKAFLIVTANDHLAVGHKAGKWRSHFHSKTGEKRSVAL